MMSLWDALRMNMMISYQELVRTFLNLSPPARVGSEFHYVIIVITQNHSNSGIV